MALKRTQKPFYTKAQQRLESTARETLQRGGTGAREKAAALFDAAEARMAKRIERHQDRGGRRAAAYARPVSRPVARHH